MAITRMLGRKPRTFNPTVPHMRALRGEQQTPLPASLSWLHGMPSDLGMMLNGPTPGNPNALVLGDCTCAGLTHARQIWTYNATGTMVTLPDEYVLKLYEQGAGYVLNDPSTDNGANEQDLLMFAHKTGIPTPSGPDKILGFVEIDFTNIDDVKRTIAEAGVVYLGINIPESWCSAPVGSIWDVDNGPVGGGHCIIGAAYDDTYIYVVSWGNIWPMTWAAFRQVTDEGYLIGDNAWFNARGATPFNMDITAFNNAMSQLRYNP